MEKKQKVLLVHNYYQIPGGEDTVVANEKKLLEDYGHEVILYTRNNTELKAFSKFQKILLPLTTVFNIRTYREVQQIIRKKKIDIVHVHNTLTLVSPAVYYAALSCKIPVVQTVHNFRLLCPGATLYRDGHICEDCIIYGIGFAVKHSCYRGSTLQTLACVVSTLLHRALGVYGKLSYICLTDFNREMLIRFKQVKSEKVFVKPNFVDSQKMIIPFEQRENQFIFSGRIDKLKGIDLLLEAWKLMGSTETRLLICGTGPMEEWCHIYINENHLDNVEMLGFIPNSEVKRIIANSLALILPTQWYEGFPMTIVEAFSTGTPVIGSGMGNVGRLLSQYDKSWCFKSDSPVDICNVVKALKADCQDIYHYYYSKYTSETNYKKIREIYRSLEIKK